MAHVGNQYKLLDRRDLSLDLTSYRPAMGEALRITFDLVTRPPSPKVYAVSAAIAPVASQPFSHQPFWQTEEITRNGRIFRLRMEIVGLFGKQHVPMFFSAIDENDVEQFRASMVRNPPNYCRWNSGVFGAFVMPLVYNSTYWGGPLDQAQITTQETPWSLYPT